MLHIGGLGRDECIINLFIRLKNHIFKMYYIYLNALNQNNLFIVKMNSNVFS